MLARIKGTVVEIGPFRAIVDVSGFGLDVQLTKKATFLCMAGEDVFLNTHVQYSDSGPTLFGFADVLEKAVFLRLLLVRGIGGKLALQILQSISAEAIVQAITLADTAVLTTVPGVGKKTAERICFELHEKMAENLPASSVPDVRSSGGLDVRTVLEALESLGFARQQAAEGLAFVTSERGTVEDLKEEELIMLVLQQLNNR